MLYIQIDGDPRTKKPIYHVVDEIGHVFATCSGSMGGASALMLVETENGISWDPVGWEDRLLNSYSIYTTIKIQRKRNGIT